MSYIYNLLAGSTIFLSIVGYSVFRFSDQAIDTIAFTRIHAIFTDRNETCNSGIKLCAIMLIYKFYGFAKRLFGSNSRSAIEQISLEGSRNASMITTQAITNRKEYRCGLIQCLWALNVQTVLSKKRIVRDATGSLMLVHIEPQEVSSSIRKKTDYDTLYNSFNQIFDNEFEQANDKGRFENTSLPPNLFLMLSVISQRSFSVVSSHIIKSSKLPITWEKYSSTFINIYDNIFENSFEIDNDTEIEDDYELVNIATTELHNSNLHNQNMMDIHNIDTHSNETASVVSERTLIGNRTTRKHKSTNKRFCKAGLDWVAMGFQGNDPSTDFRGSGKFGVDCLEHITSISPQLILTMLIESGSYSCDENNSNDIMLKPWYSFALISIGLSRWIIDILQDNPGLIMKICYNSIDVEKLIKETVPMEMASVNTIDWSIPQGIRVENTFQTLIDDYKITLLELHLKLVIEFHSYWKVQVSQGKVKTIMDTEACMKSYKCSIIEGKFFQTWREAEVSKNSKSR